jgi:hypothetical protein
MKAKTSTFSAAYILRKDKAKFITSILGYTKINHLTTVFMQTVRLCPFHFPYSSPALILTTYTKAFLTVSYSRE